MNQQGFLYKVVLFISFLYYIALLLHLKVNCSEQLWTMRCELLLHVL